MLRSVIIAIVILAFALEQTLDWLNHRAANDPVHPDLADMYDEETLSKQRSYSAARYRAGIVYSSFSTLVLLLALSLGWFGTLDAWLRARMDAGVLLSLAFFGIAWFASFLLGLPASIHSTFVIEERFGFNKTTAGTFVADKLKGMALTLIVGGALVGAIAWIHERLRDAFWIAGWALFAGFSLFMFTVGTALFVRLFNKLTPVEPGELRTAIEEYCASQGYTLKRLFMMDGSKRSTKANAFFTGLGKSKTIVLFDTLVDQCTTDEVVAVLAHEIGHYKLKHTLASFIAGNVQTFAIFVLLGWMLNYPEPSLALGGDQASFHLSAIAFLLLLTPLELVLAFANNWLSRHNELEADAFAKRTYASAPLGQALRKMARNSLSNPTPHPWYVAAHYTHPPLQQRLAHL